MMQRVVLVSLLFILQSSTALSQRLMLPNKADEALQAQQGFRPGAIPNARAQRTLFDVVVVPRADLELEARMLMVQLANLVTRSYLLGDNSSNRDLLDKVLMKLEKNAEARIPGQATEAQRVKLRAAAAIDVRRKKIELSSQIEKQGKVNIHQFIGGAAVEIFGSESLFAKVMRHQGLQ